LFDELIVDISEICPFSFVFSDLSLFNNFVFDTAIKDKEINDNNNKKLLNNDKSEKTKENGHISDMSTINSSNNDIKFSDEIDRKCLVENTLSKNNTQNIPFQHSNINLS
jgi:ATP-dependent protease HslVU (ClpYQ) ATPase subunit